MPAEPLAAYLEAMLRDHFEVNAEALHPDATFEELELDSLAMAEILAIIEDERGLRISHDLGLTSETTLRQAVQLITSLLEEQAAASSPAVRPHTFPPSDRVPAEQMVTDPASEPASVAR
ncbi:acyl carrier protein [Streptomyces sp. NPDC053493]|uniref:acyl carrier protein n=1 Tax=Streptomyces sp. NPDC053493 TaxID=3365705 RepID=UPI0037CE5320